MPDKSPIEQLHDAVSKLVHGAVTDPVGTAGKAAQQARGVLSLGFLVVGQVAQTVAERLMQSPTPPPSAPRPPGTPYDDPEPATPADLASVVELKPAADRVPPVNKAPVKRAPAKKAPPKKTTTAKAPAKKAPPKKT